MLIFIYLCVGTIVQFDFLFCFVTVDINSFQTFILNFYRGIF